MRGHCHPRVAREVLDGGRQEAAQSPTCRGASGGVETASGRPDAGEAEEWHGTLPKPGVAEVGARGGEDQSQPVLVAPAVQAGHELPLAEPEAAADLLDQGVEAVVGKLSKRTRARASSRSRVCTLSAVSRSIAARARKRGKGLGRRVRVLGVSRVVVCVLGRRSSIHAASWRKASRSARTPQTRKRRCRGGVSLHIRYRGRSPGATKVDTKCSRKRETTPPCTEPGPKPDRQQLALPTYQWPDRWLQSWYTAARPRSAVRPALDSVPPPAVR